MVLSDIERAHDKWLDIISRSFLSPEGKQRYQDILHDRWTTIF